MHSSGVGQGFEGSLHADLGALLLEVLRFPGFLSSVPAPLADLSSNLWHLRSEVLWFSNWVLAIPCHADRDTVHSGEDSYKCESPGSVVFCQGPIPLQSLLGFGSLPILSNTCFVYFIHTLKLHYVGELVQHNLLWHYQHRNLTTLILKLGKVMPREE